MNSEKLKSDSNVKDVLCKRAQTGVETATSQSNTLSQRYIATKQTMNGKNNNLKFKSKSRHLLREERWILIFVLVDFIVAIIMFLRRVRNTLIVIGPFFYNTVSLVRKK